MRIIITAFALFTILSLTGCKQTQDLQQAHQPSMSPSVLLTFDDTYIDQWVEVLPVFERYDAKATFFITRFDQLSESQIDGLKKLQSAGHTIGCHGLKHIKAVDYVNKFSIEKYWQDEIEPALTIMNEHGFYPSSFAYPSSQNNIETDSRLLEYFSHLRSGVHYRDVEKIFVPTGKIKNRGCLYGTSIDSSNKNLTIGNIFEIMDKAKAEDKCVVFYGHNISDGTTRLYTTPERLESILEYGQKIGVDFIGFDCISKDVSK